MASPFNAVPIFDAHRQFVRLPSGIRMLNDYPETRHFIETLERDIPEVSSDFLYAQSFLKSYSRKNAATYTSYRNEIERLLLWSWTTRRASIVAVKRADLEQYFDFVHKPPKQWVAAAVHSRFKLASGAHTANPLWRPFVVKIAKQDHRSAQENGIHTTVRRDGHRLSNEAMKLCFSALSCFYDYLTDENYAFGNPIPAIRKQSPYLIKGATQKEIKRLSDSQWSYVLKTAQRAADEHEDAERALFILAMLKTLYLRVSELSERPNWRPTWQHFWSDNAGNSWFKVLGKGNKIRDISVPNALLPYIQRYRSVRQLNDFSFGENSSLVTKNRGAGGMTSRQLRRIVQSSFDAAYQHMIEQDVGGDAEALRVATTHWLRHTGASQDIATRPLKHMADDLGHASMGTTDKVYIQSDMKERAGSGRTRDV